MLACYNLAVEATVGTPLYVHLPFCAAKCHYCDFYSVPADGHDRRGMVNAILAEARVRAPRAPSTVFFGGGTPSLLEPDELALLFDGLDDLCGWRTSSRETTVECNPESLDQAKAATLLALGATRLSIGFQSLDASTLQLFGRVHGVEDSFRAYAAARAAGATNINIDLIYATPEQPLEQWLDHLDRVLALGPDHVSAYNLTFEEDTVFRRWLEQGRLRRQDEEQELRFFEDTRARLAQGGWPAYEISNFARAGRECAHNLHYWRNGDYVGLGPSAVSKQGATRSGNIKAIGAYAREALESRRPQAWEETPTDRQRLAETWWLGLRTREGLSRAAARARAAFDSDDEFLMREVRALEQHGVLACVDEHWHLTHRGLPLADWIAKRLLALAD
ncbi:MAG: Oxygen-independent coproporphyrinogen-III oxidase 1 [Planctomycetota bacterium]